MSGRVDPAPWQALVDRLAALGAVSTTYEPQDDAPRWRLRHPDPGRPLLSVTPFDGGALLHVDLQGRYLGSWLWTDDEADPVAEVERHAREVVAGRARLAGGPLSRPRLEVLGTPVWDLADRGTRRLRGAVPGWASA